MATRMRNWQSKQVRRRTACGRCVPRPSRGFAINSIRLQPKRQVMLTDQSDEKVLFRGFDALVPQQATALRAIEQTRQLLLQIPPSETAGTSSAKKTTRSAPANWQSS